MRQEARFFKAMAKYVAKHRTGELQILGGAAALTAIVATGGAAAFAEGAIAEGAVGARRRPKREGLKRTEYRRRWCVYRLNVS